VTDSILLLMAPPAKARRSIGFRVEEARPHYRVRRLRRPTWSPSGPSASSPLRFSVLP